MALPAAACLSVRCALPGHPHFPGALARIPDSPRSLYWIGARWPPPERAVAVVGSRGASGYGLEMAETLAGDLARAGICVVSGLARGIDAAAHRAALAAGGATVAVLAAAPQTAYPPDMSALHGEIVAAGAVCAEYPAGVALRRGLFVRRNRLVSGLALGIVVVEAGPASGALATARAAWRQGRFVAAVPGDATRETAAGTLALLRAGAVPVGSAGHVLALVARSGSARPDEPLDAAGAVLRLVDGRAQTCDRVAAELGWPVGRAAAALLELEMAGAVRRLPGGFYTARSGGRR